MNSILLKTIEWNVLNEFPVQYRAHKQKPNHIIYLTPRYGIVAHFYFSTSIFIPHGRAEKRSLIDGNVRPIQIFWSMRVSQVLLYFLQNGFFFTFIFNGYIILVLKKKCITTDIISITSYRYHPLRVQFSM